MANPTYIEINLDDEDDSKVSSEVVKKIADAMAVVAEQAIQQHMDVDFAVVDPHTGEPIHISTKDLQVLLQNVTEVAVISDSNMARVVRQLVDPPELLYEADFEDTE